MRVGPPKRTASGRAVRVARVVNGEIDADAGGERQQTEHERADTATRGGFNLSDTRGRGVRPQT